MAKGKPKHRQREKEKGAPAGFGRGHDEDNRQLIKQDGNSDMSIHVSRRGSLTVTNAASKQQSDEANSSKCLFVTPYFSHFLTKLITHTTL